MMRYDEGANRFETSETAAIHFNAKNSRLDAEACLAAFFHVSIGDVRSAFDTFFSALPEDGHVIFYENLEGALRPDKFPPKPIDIVGYDSSGKALFRVVVSFPLLKGDFCSVLKTSNLRFFELSHDHRREVLEIRERFERLFSGPQA